MAFPRVSKPGSWWLTAIFAVVAGIGSAKAEDSHRWTDEEVHEEIGRLRLIEPAPAKGQTYLVVSRFYERPRVSSEAPALSLAVHPEARRRAEQLQSFLAGLPNVRYSVLSGKVGLLIVERRDDRECVRFQGCYPLGHAVGIGPVSSGLDVEVCPLFRANGWFCAEYRVPD